MAAILVRAFDTTNADPEKSDISCYKKGDIVVIEEDGHEWGSHEGPPYDLPTIGFERFVRVLIPGTPRADIIEWIDKWGVVIVYEQLGRDVALDGWRWKLTNETEGVNLGKLERAKIEAWLLSWNCTIVTHDERSVTIDWRIYDGATSSAFWGTDVDLVEFSELSYNESTGVHRIEADYSAAGWDPDAVERRIVERGGTVVNHNHAQSKVRFDIDRQTVLDHLKEDFEAKQSRLRIRRRRYMFDPTDVDDVLNNFGGERTLTLPQAQNAVIDKTTVL